MGRKIFIRADGSADLGTGHIMRMLVLSRSLGAMNCSVTFLMKTLDGLGIGMVRDAGFPVLLLDDTDDEAHRVGACGGTLIVDHYGIDEAYLETVRTGVDRVIAIDDLADRRYPVDMVINQNLGAETFRIKALPETRLLLGPSYALLRDQFLERRGGVSLASKKILLSFGGSDPLRQTERFLRVLAPVAKGYEIHAVAGRGAEVHRNVKQENVFLHSNVKDMAALMRGMEFAFSAGGTTHLELACLGVPAALVIVADNQVRVAEEGERSGAFFNLGWCHEASDDRIREAFQRLSGDPGLRERMGQAGAELVDGQGAQRVARAVHAL